jgi:hypothetical protein
MKPHQQNLLTRMSAMAATEGFAAHSFEFNKAASDGVITHALLRKALEVCKAVGDEDMTYKVVVALEELPVRRNEDVVIDINGERLSVQEVQGVILALARLKGEMAVIEGEAGGDPVLYSLADNVLNRIME